ncbi:hypothetical protein STENM223S_07990 [Streptomyces tendae]
MPSPPNGCARSRRRASRAASTAPWSPNSAPSACCPGCSPGALDLCLIRESLARACTEAETALALQGLGAHPVHAHGTESQRARWLPG